MSEEKKTYMPVVSIKKVENGSFLVAVSVYVNTGHTGEPWPDMRNDPVYVRYCVSTKGWEDHDPEKEWLCLDDGLRYFAPSDIVRAWIAKRISEDKKVVAIRKAFSASKEFILEQFKSGLGDGVDNALDTVQGLRRKIQNYVKDFPSGYEEYKKKVLRGCELIQDAHYDFLEDVHNGKYKVAD